MSRRRSGRMTEWIGTASGGLNHADGWGYFLKTDVGKVMLE
jgi:hypothetical protein